MYKIRATSLKLGDHEGIVMIGRDSDYQSALKWAKQYWEQNSLNVDEVYIVNDDDTVVASTYPKAYRSSLIKDILA